MLIRKFQILWNKTPCGVVYRYKGSECS